MSALPHRSARLPRAGIDPIADPTTALGLLSVAACPTRHETILVLLDVTRRGLGLVVVSDTSDPDAVVDVAARVLDPAVHDGRVAAVIVASVRPGRHHLDLDDADRWLELDHVTSREGAELVEWFVLGSSVLGSEVSCPRELLNAPPRW